MQRQRDAINNNSNEPAHPFIQRKTGEDVLASAHQMPCRLNNKAGLRLPVNGVYLIVNYWASQLPARYLRQRERRENGAYSLLHYNKFTNRRNVVRKNKFLITPEQQTNLMRRHINCVSLYLVHRCDA